MAYQNFFATKLYTDIGAADTVITLEIVPTETSGTLVLEARNATQREIIKYSGVSGNQITGVVRGQGGTNAKQHLKNSLVEMNVTAEDLNAALGLAFAFPTGIVMPYSGGSAPSGWLLAQGQAVSRTTYSALFAVVGTSFNTGGEAATDFRLPDMKGRVVVGMDAADADFNTLGKSGGQKTLQKHSHSGLWATTSYGQLRLDSAGGAGANTALTFGRYAATGNDFITGETGTGANNMNPYLALNYIIKT